jgi:hypothetical protein
MEGQHALTLSAGGPKLAMLMPRTLAGTAPRPMAKALTYGRGSTWLRLPPLAPDAAIVHRAPMRAHPRPRLGLVTRQPGAVQDQAQVDDLLISSARRHTNRAAGTRPSGTPPATRVAFSAATPSGTGHLVRTSDAGPRDGCRRGRSSGDCGGRPLDHKVDLQDLNFLHFGAGCPDFGPQPCAPQTVPRR